MKFELGLPRILVNEIRCRFATQSPLAPSLRSALGKGGRRTGSVRERTPSALPLLFLCYLLFVELGQVRKTLECGASDFRTVPTFPFYFSGDYLLINTPKTNHSTNSPKGTMNKIINQGLTLVKYILVLVSRTRP